MKVGLEFSPIMVLVLFLSFLGIFFSGNADSFIVYARRQELPLGRVKKLKF